MQKPDTAETAGRDSTHPEAEDIFQACQTYVYVTIELSEPIFPQPDKRAIRSDANDLVRQYDYPTQFPSSRDAINEFKSAINYVVLQIAAEY